MNLDKNLAFENQKIIILNCLSVSFWISKCVTDCIDVLTLIASDHIHISKVVSVSIVHMWVALE